MFNRSAGVGHGEEEAQRLSSAIGGAKTALVDDHVQARAASAAWVVTAARPSLVVAAGGGGTLRAVVEGVMDAFPDAPPGRDVVRIGALRMGSGNVIARRLGVPSDPVEAATRMARAFAEGITAPCSVMRCRHGGPHGTTSVRHAVTMAGFGAWGRVPGDLGRWREGHNVARRRAAAWIGLERLNTIEYLVAGSVRMLAGTVLPSRCELVQIDGAGKLRLLAGVALNLPLPPLPDPKVELGDEAAGVVIVPRLRRPFRLRIEPGRAFRLSLLDRESVEFFLDEDPETAFGWLELEVPGTLAFVPVPAR